MPDCERLSLSSVLAPSFVVEATFTQSRRKRLANFWVASAAVADQKTQSFLHVLEIGAIDD